MYCQLIKNIRKHWSKDMNSFTINEDSIVLNFYCGLNTKYILKRVNKLLKKSCDICFDSFHIEKNVVTMKLRNK